ncbi:iron-sulfur flavoprotein [Andreesenia angusta]|uniref:Iron-sulfur flavoprotein n=1 Tax=Andreesenia angusta TaxID=39480 RepID=A0A1S1V8L9_9FIRM|nr:flavodoxin family protein [Andreesenia angusta]OHW62844.1 iron-sulfur flavoprotein [Andreesenia angusta]
MKKVIALMASPNKGKNTDTLVDKFLEGISDSGEKVEIKKYVIRDMNIGFCIGCNYCEKTGNCFQDDDMNELYEAFDSSDGIILGSPIYFGGITTYGKLMIDRCQIYWSSKYVLGESSIDRGKKRFGAFISTVGAPEKYSNFTGSQQVASVFFKSINTEQNQAIYVANTDEQKTWENAELLEDVYQKGKAFFEGF